MPDVPTMSSPLKASSQEEGRIFVGGLSHVSTKETVEDYCRQWCAH